MGIQQAKECSLVQSSCDDCNSLIEQQDIHQLLESKFGSREDLLMVVKGFYFKLGYALSIKSSRKDKYVTVGCDRGGHHRDRQNIPNENRQRKTTTRLINCPFELQGRREEDGFWKVVTKNDSHNHEASIDMSGHPSTRVLSKEEIASIDQMTRAGIAPKQILSSLRQRNPNLQAISRSIYNAKGKIQRESLAGRSTIQVLYEELGKGDFTFDIKRDETGHLTHLFFAHPTSIKLSRSYSTVFVMDCTYKTNRYHMPLLEIIGVTSFNTSFFSSFVFLKNEGHEDYIWALNTFRKVLGPESQPLVIVTDRELALMKAIKVVFPEAANLLCVWHIQKNIVGNCKSIFEKQEDFDGLLSAWNFVVYSSTEEAFVDAWQEFETSYKNKNDVLNYIRKTWLPHKNKFVSAWTEKYLHLGNRATSRAEGAHSKLKKYLLISTGDLRVVKEKMCLLMANDFQEIKTKLSSQRLAIPLKCNIPFFKEVVTRISTFAMERLHEQYEKVQKHTMTMICTGEFTTTMGLPCAHTMIGWKEIPLEVIHPHWRIDTRSSLFIENETNVGDNALEGLVTTLHGKYKQWPLIEKEDAREKLSQLVSDSVPLLFEPNVQTSKGRPVGNKKRKASSSTKRDPSKFELVEASRKCSFCKGTGHDIRKCPVKNGSNVISLDQGITLVDAGGCIDPIDLNMMPNLSKKKFWDTEFGGENNDFMQFDCPTQWRT